jgi:hypothetical protein
VSWADGFLRRGLLGTLLLPLGCARFDPRLIWTIQCLVLAVLLCLFVRFGRRGLAGLALCVFLASDAGAFLFNEVGYPEQIVLLTSFASWLLLRRGWHVPAALLLGTAALVHELALFTALPAALVFWLRLPPEKRKPLWVLFLPSALAAAWLLFAGGPVAVGLLWRYASLAEACGHPLARPDFVGHYQEGLGQALKLYYNPWELGLQVLPLVACLGLFFLKARPLLRLRTSLSVATWAACCCPLLLGWVGWDTGRWIFLALAQTLMLISTGQEAAPEVDGGQGSGAAFGTLAWSAPLIVLVLLLRIPLFDGAVPRPLDAPALRNFVSPLR